MDAWTRPYEAQSSTTTAVYFTLHNNTSSTVQLVAANIASTDTVEIHQSIVENGLMRMRPQKSVFIEAGHMLSFEPGSHHLMVKGLQSSLALDDSLLFKLEFASHPPITGTAHVKWE